MKVQIISLFLLVLSFNAQADFDGDKHFRTNRNRRDGMRHRLPVGRGKNLLKIKGIAANKLFKNIDVEPIEIGRDEKKGLVKKMPGLICKKMKKENVEQKAKKGMVNCTLKKKMKLEKMAAIFDIIKKEAKVVEAPRVGILKHEVKNVAAVKFVKITKEDGTVLYRFKKNKILFVKGEDAKMIYNALGVEVTVKECVNGVVKNIKKAGTLKCVSTVKVVNDETKEKFICSLKRKGKKRNHN